MNSRKKTPSFTIAIDQRLLAELHHKMEFLEIHTRSISKLVNVCLHMLNNGVDSQLSESFYAPQTFTQSEAISYLKKYFGKIAEQPRGIKVTIPSDLIPNKESQLARAEKLAAEIQQQK